MLKQILRKFEQLPEEKKRFLSSPMVLSSLEKIEKKYKVKLALILMEVAVDKGKADNLANFLENRLALEKNIAFQISQELEESIFKEFNVIGNFKNEEQTEQKTILEKPIEIKQDSIGNVDVKTQNTITEDSAQNEIKEIENEIKELNPISVKSVDWGREADEIISRLDINFKNDLLKNKFKNIIISAIKGVRSPIDFRDILQRREDKAGMELSGIIISEILSAVKKRKQEIEDGDGLEKQEQEDIKEYTIKEEQDLPIIHKSDKITVDAEKKDLDNIIFEDEKQKVLSPPPPVIIKQENIKDEPKDEGQNTEKILDETEIQIQDKKTEDKKEPVKKTESFMDFLFSKRHKKNVEPKFFEKKKIKDFKKIVQDDKSSKLVGPIDELAGLTIEDFKSWSENPYEAIKKIKEKIKLLAKESLEKGNLGMKAWKKSEINRVYLDILHNAIINRKQVDMIIQDMKNERKQTLTLEEFEAIEQLNRELRA